MQRTMLAAGLVIALAGCKHTTDERNDALIETARACAKHGELSCPRPILSVRSLRASQPTTAMRSASIRFGSALDDHRR